MNKSILKSYQSLNEIYQDYKKHKDLYKFTINTIRLFSCNISDVPYIPLIEILKYYNIKLVRPNTYQMCSFDNMINLITAITKQNRELVRRIVWKGHYDGWYGSFTVKNKSLGRVTGITTRNPDLELN